MHYLSSVYFVDQPLHVLGISVAPSSGSILYIYKNWYMLCSLVDCLLVIYCTVLTLVCRSTHALLADDLPATAWTHFFVKDTHTHVHVHSVLTSQIFEKRMYGIRNSVIV
jgi:hypothetical protein